jgi:sulfur carrier protein
MWVVLTIQVNGNAHNIAEGATVRDLIVELGLGERAVAVERNREVVPRADHASVRLENDDHLELVSFVGGG